jgi:hypothetical protein
MHYYTTEILQEAKVFKEYAGLSANQSNCKKQQLDVNDVKIAIESKSYQSFTRPLPVSVLKQIAQEKNAIDLPKFEDTNQLGSGDGGVIGIGSSMMGLGASQKLGGRVNISQKIDNILPKQEYRQTNPNIHIYSEELAKTLEEKQMRL